MNNAMFDAFAGFESIAYVTKIVVIICKPNDARHRPTSGPNLHVLSVILPSNTP